MAFKKTGMEGISSLGLERWMGSSDRPARILFEELRRFRPLFAAMNIGFFVSRARVRIKGGELKEPPYFACRYDAGSLEGINILAFCYPLIADWSLLDDDVEQYRKRIRSALREEMSARREGRVFDRIDPAFERYASGGKRDCAYEMWTFRHRTRRVPAGRILRLIVQTAAVVHWTTDDWACVGKSDTVTSGFTGLHFFDLPAAESPSGARAEWTFFWPAANRWEGGENFRAEIV